MEVCPSRGWKALHITQAVGVDLLATREVKAKAMTGVALNISLVMGERQEPLVLKLVDGDQVKGVVRNADGSPASNVVLRAYWAGPKDPDGLKSICAQPLDDWALQSKG